MRMMKTFQFIFLILFSLVVTACGFQLRSQNQLPPQLHTLYFHSDNPYGVFETALQQTLHSAGIKLVQSPNEAPVVLNMRSVNFSHTVPTLGNSTLARTYTFNGAVSFDLTDSHGKVLLPTQTVTSTHSLTLNANQLLETNDQATLLQQEMTRELINKVFNRLSAEQTSQALATTLKEPSTPAQKKK